jgi:hypothetical protein
VELDVKGIRELWGKTPGLPQPETDAEALASLHRARTQAESVPLKLRAYSHRWLQDNNLPSGLPDSLRPKAERIYPRVVDGVGISVNASSLAMRPIVPIVQRAMEDTVQEAYADGDTEPTLLKTRMMEARVKAVKKLVG